MNTFHTISNELITITGVLGCIFLLAIIIHWIAQKLTQHLINKMIEKEIKKEFSPKVGDLVCFRFKDQLDIGIVRNTYKKSDKDLFLLNTKWAKGWTVGINNCYSERVWELYKKFPSETLNLLIPEGEEI